jgi:hypothetical protein
MASVTEPAIRERWATSDLVLRMALVLAAAYARTVTFDFVFDDHLQIALHSWIQAWRFVPHYFTGHVWVVRAAGVGRELLPAAAGYHYALGAVLRQQGKQDKAAVEFRAEAVNRKRIDEQMKALGLDVVQ